MKLGNRDVDKLTELLYGRLFTKRYSHQDIPFNSNQYKTLYRTGVAKMKDLRGVIRNNLLAGFDIYTGYSCTKIRGIHTVHIWYKTNL